MNVAGTLSSANPAGADGCDSAASAIRLEPMKSWRSLDLAELWRFRQLLYFLVWRDLKVRYKQTVVGLGWAVLQPLLYMSVLTIVFGRLANIPSEGVPYPLFAFAGLLPWTYFATASAAGATSLVAEYNLISKTYFPRLLIPLGIVVSNAVDILVGSLLLIGILLFFGIAPSPRLALLPLFITFAALTALAVSTWLSALDVRYRDVRSTIPFLFQAWMFATPVIYPASLVSGKYAALFGLNPMAGVVEGFRWVIFPSRAMPGQLLAVSLLVVVVVLVSGMFYFRSNEAVFADVI